MVGIRSPDGLVVGSCTSHPGVLGSIPKREEPGKTGAPCIKVPGSSRVPAPPWVGSRSPDGWDQIPRWAGGWACTSHPGVLGSIPKRETQPRPGWAPDPLMVGIRSPDGLVVGLAPATLEFWVRFPNERNQGKQAHPVLKYRVPQGSHPPPFTQSPYPPRSLVRAGQTHPHRPRLVVSHSTCPPLSSSPHAHSFVIGPAVIKHTPPLYPCSPRPRVRDPCACARRGQLGTARRSTCHSAGPQSHRC
jgi:hypothetical protein